MRELKGDWKDLFSGFMVALDLRKMFLALCGIVMTIIFCGGLTITLGNELDRDYVVVPRDLVLHKWWRAQCQSWHVIFKGTEESRLTFKHIVKDGKDNVMQHRLPVPKGGDLRYYLPYSVVFILLFVAIWSYFGGAIARIAACEIARDGERIETRKALQFSRKKFWQLFWAPLICVIGFLFFAFCNAAGGLVGKLLDMAYVGAPLVALLLPLALLSGFIMALIVVGTAAGFPLFAPAVAAEGTDSFDAVSRGFSYVYSRPWHYVGYQAVTWGYGYICIAFVILFAIAMCHLGIQAGTAGFELCGFWGKGEFKDMANGAWGLILSDEHTQMDRYSWDASSLVTEPHPYGRLQTLANQITCSPALYIPSDDLRTDHRFAGFLLTLWLAVALGLALGYAISYFLSQQTMIYFILRKKVDGIEMNEVFDEEEAAPAEPAKPAEGAPAEVKPAEPPKPPEEKK